MGDRKVIVGVSGGSGSGKTTFCRQLVNRLGEHQVVHLKQDSYYRDLSHLSSAERDAVNFDHPQALEFDLLCEHLKALRGGVGVEVPVYDFATHTRSADSIRTVAKPIIVIEGILILSQSRILEQLQYSIFVDAPQDVRLARRIRRDIAERGRTKESVEQQFFATVAPMHDLFVEPCKQNSTRIISGEQPFDDSIEQLVRHLMRDVASRQDSSQDN
ncbi:MAG: uridine kinase [Silvanigrellaceae bacterium]